MTRPFEFLERKKEKHFSAFSQTSPFKAPRNKGKVRLNWGKSEIKLGEKWDHSGEKRGKLGESNIHPPHHPPAPPPPRNPKRLTFQTNWQVAPCGSHLPEKVGQLSRLQISGVPTSTPLLLPGAEITNYVNFPSRLGDFQGKMGPT